MPALTFRGKAHTSRAEEEDEVNVGRVRVGAVQVVPSLTRVESAWFQHLKLKYEATAFKFCFHFQLAPPQLDLSDPPALARGRPAIILTMAGASAASPVAAFGYPVDVTTYSPIQDCH